MPGAQPRQHLADVLGAVAEGRLDEDLDRLEAVLHGQVVGEGELIAPKGDIDHEAWNKRA